MPHVEACSLEIVKKKKKKVVSAMNKNLLCQHKVKIDEAGHRVHISLNETLLLSISFSL